MSQFVAVGNAVNERPQIVTLAAVGDGDDQEHEEDEKPREDLEEESVGGFFPGSHEDDFRKRHLLMSP